MWVVKGMQREEHREQGSAVVPTRHSYVTFEHSQLLFPSFSPSAHRGLKRGRVGVSLRGKHAAKCPTQSECSVNVSGQQC